MKDKKNNFQAADEPEIKEQGGKFTFSKFDYDLFDEEKHIPEKIVRVKRLSSSEHGEKWKITVNNEVMLVVLGSKLLKREREFFRTIDGINFLISQGKLEIKSLNKLRLNLKEKLKK